MCIDFHNYHFFINIPLVPYAGHYFLEFSLFLPSHFTVFKMYIDMQFWYERYIASRTMNSKYLGFQTLPDAFLRDSVK